MGSLRYPELEAELARGLLRPVYYFAGDEDVLKNDAVTAVVGRALDAAERQFNCDDRYVGDLDAERLATLLYTPPLLAERRVVVLRGVEALRRKPKLRRWLAEAIASPASEMVVVLVSGAGEKRDEQLTPHAAVTVFDTPSPEEAAVWIERRAETLGLRLDHAAVVALFEVCAGSLAAIDGEIAKLAAALGDVPATADDVVSFAGIRRGETLADLVEAVLARDTSHALQLVDYVLDQPGVNGVRTVMALGTALVGTRLALAAAAGGAKGRRLHDSVFQSIRRVRPAGLGAWKEVADQWARWARRWTDQELKMAIARALEADRALKSSGVVGESGILRHFIVATSRREAA
jgi:DNA polymerase-3 subunit delta